MALMVVVVTCALFSAHRTANGARRRECTQPSQPWPLGSGRICKVGGMKCKIEFLGGLDVISGQVREHACTLPFKDGTMRDLIAYICEHVITDPKDVPVFLEDNTVRPGILVLINDTDWELEGMEDYVLESGDVYTFTSTLHGG